MNGASTPLLADHPETAIEEGLGPELSDGVVPISIDVSSLHYYLGTSTKPAHILKDVSVRFSPGQLTAVMGPSGAGKTTLLNILIGNAGGRVEGKVLINGRELRDVQRRFKKLQTLVPQDDTLLSSLTAREALTFAARLRLPFHWSAARKQKMVDRVLADLSLTGCADQRIGNVDYRGISGGQRKRVSIALELLVNPSVMFVDEPTSGLDAKMAEDVVNTLSKLASEGRNLITTIHQPSYKIFRKFDRLVLLSAGSVVYNGPTSTVEAYFSTLGYDTPRGENPADFFMHVLQLGPEETDDNGTPACDLPGAWVERGADFEDYSGAPALETLPDLKVTDMGDGVPVWYQFLVLFHRCLVDNLKDKEKFVSGLSLKLGVGVVVGLVWFKQAGTTQDSIFPQTGALFIASTSSVLDTLFATVLTFPRDKTLLLREYKNGYFGLLPYYLAQLATAVLFNAFFAIFMGTPIYLLLGFDFVHHFGRYLLFIATLAVLAGIGATLGLLVGSLVKDVQSAQQAVMPTVVPLLLFSGYLIPLEKIAKYYRFLYWMSPFAAAFKILQTVLFRDLVFTDCLTPPYQCYAFNCYGVPPRTICYKTGRAYLDDMGAGEDQWALSWGILAAVFSALFLGGYISMRVFVSKKTN